MPSDAHKNTHIRARFCGVQADWSVMRVILKMHTAFLHRRICFREMGMTSNKMFLLDFCP
jgi:hypothetical protein